MALLISIIKSRVYKLYQNYPNPFNSQTNIKIDITHNINLQNPNVKLIVYDLLGREIVTLINQQLKPGSYKVDWPAPSGDADNYPSGIYFYKLTVQGNIIDTKKMILIK
jgi:hypothetical protein